MKQNIIKALFALFVMCSIFSCHDHEDFQSPHLNKVSIEFDSIQVRVKENVNQYAINLSLDKPASKSGMIILSLSNASASRFTVEPADTNKQIILPIQKNQKVITVQIKPIDNALLDGNFEFDLSITGTSPEYSIGTRKTSTIIILDDELPVQQVIANFSGDDKNLSEANTEGHTFTVLLSDHLQTVGLIELSVESAKAIYGTHFTTVPSLIGERIILNPAIGENKVSFTVLPINNAIITGDLAIAFSIAATTGAIVKGTEIDRTIIIKDDELANKPKGFEVVDGQWGLKKIYEYDEYGRVKYVHTEKSSPATSAHTETYYYDFAGRIQKINTYPQIDIVFTWSANRIVKAETIDNGVLKEYIEYDYDAQGNVSGTANYFRQQDGQFKLGFLNIYLYFLDNNLYKSQTYIPVDGSDEYTLISTKTYEGYLSKDNPFPMVDILPTVKTQNQLPTRYTLEEHGVKLIYNLSYEFREDGLVSKRITKSGNVSEVSTYQYY